MLDTVYAIGDASSQVHSLSYMVYISTFQMHLPRKGFHFEFFLSQVLLKQDILATACGEASGSHYVFSIANSVNIKCSYTT